MKRFVVYSLNRNVMYYNDEDLSQFWVAYLKYKYPKDRWIATDTDAAVYRELKSSIRDPAKSIFLNDPTSKVSRRFMQDMYRVKETLALAQISSLTPMIFVVSHGTRDSVNLPYVGHSVHDALDALSKNKLADNVEVYQDGKLLDTLYSLYEYDALIERLKAR